MIIKPADDWDIYYSVWQEGMENVYWFKDSGLFDYTRDEDTASLEQQFHEKDNIFLIATEHNQPKGVLGIRVSKSRGSIRRWEPVTIAPEDYEVGDALLKAAVLEAKNRKLLSLSTVLRYRVGAPKPWLSTLYESNGFRDIKPGLQLIKSLKDNQTSHVSIFETSPANNYPIEQMRDITLMSFASQPEDIMVHGDDARVSDPFVVTNQLELIMKGAFGETDEQLMRVALLDGEPAGFIMGAIREESNRPRYGVIAILGVLPEYRRRGVGSSLSRLILSRYKERKCEYAYLGTPRINHKAIRLYEGLGFKPIFYVYRYEKRLD